MTFRLSTASSLALLTSGLHFAEPAYAQHANPIARVARLINSDLVRVEDRIDWLEGRLQTIAEAQPHLLKTNMGHRGGRAQPTDPPPSVTLDLGTSHPIDAIYLVPAQGEFDGDPGMAPQKITLECSDSQDFSKATLIHRTGEKPEGFPKYTPKAYTVPHTSARYIRLTVDQGVRRGDMEVFSLSEIFVFSGNQPVSFGATTSSVGALIVNGSWHPDTLTDGRTPLGIWQNGKKAPQSSGDAISAPSTSTPTSWSLTLPQPGAIDHIVLFPYEINRSLGAFIFPEILEISLIAKGTTIYQKSWKKPIHGSTNLSPLVIPCNRSEADQITIRSAEPWAMGDQMIHALSEIQIWSGESNLASGKPFLREYNQSSASTRNLSDGYTSVQEIMPVGAWLQQLCDRHRFEDELQDLRPIRLALEAQSELHASWGASVLAGLIFLVPVFLVERRRLMSRQHLDNLRRKIASDLHDDIGSNLGSISLIARTARKDLIRLHGPESIARDLTEVESIARESSLAMRDIVWLLERTQDSIGDLYQRMRDTANRLLREIEFTLECDSAQTSTRLSLDAKRHLFLFYKEAIHNVLKHSQATRVSIRIWDEDDNFAMEIADNGIGLPRDPEQPTAHVAKLQDRAALLGGTIDISSSPDNGTRIRLMVKRSLLNSGNSP